MTFIFSIIFNFLPLLVFFICFYLLVKDFKILPALLSCFIGMLAVVPIFAVQYLLDKTSFFTNHSLGSVLINALVLNGLVEESFKMLLLFLIPSKKMKLHNFFACAILCGLTLGCFENLIYLIGGTENIGLRIVTSMLIHLSCTALSGLFVYSCKKKKAVIRPFLWAVLLHGIYNYFAGFKMNTPFFYFSFAVILVALTECRIFYSYVKSKLADIVPVEAVDSDSSTEHTILK